MESRVECKPKFTLCFKDLASFMRIDLPRYEKVEVLDQETPRIIDIKPMVAGQKSPVSVDFLETKKEE